MARRDPVLKQRIFEARYEKGYRFLDRCGDALIMLEESLSKLTDHVWFPEEMAPTGARLICPDLEITLVFNARQLVVDQTPIPNIEAEFSDIAGTAFGLIRGRFDITKLNRLGSRRIKVIPMDSVEEAETLSTKQVPIKNWYSAWQPATEGYEPRAFDFKCVFELPDKSKGIRITAAPYSKVGADLKVNERLKHPPHLLHEGQHAALMEQLRRMKVRDTNPEAGLAVDIDYYLAWPPEKASISSFLNEASAEADKLEKEFLEKGNAK
ncbi:MAG: hypothetical protein GXY38_10505 [Planctomycetes bacterium]|nr:hypothetical protein [Planctomycetota bacterium]